MVIVGDCLCETIVQTDGRLPAGGPDSADVGAFDGRSVGFAGVLNDLPFKTSCVGNLSCEVGDCQVDPRANIDPVGRVFELEQVFDCGGQVIHVQKFASRFSAAPNGDRIGVLFRSVVEAANEAWDHV